MERLKRIGSKISKLMIIALSILIIGGLITYYQNKISSLEVPEKTIAIVLDKDIKAGEVITGTHLIEKEIFKPDKLNDGISNMNDIVGKVALTTIVKGKEITEKEIADKENYFKDNERELGITFNHFTDVVGGNGRPGDIVDVMVSYPAREDELKNIIVTEPELVVAGIKLLDTYDEGNVSYKDSKEKSSFRPLTVLVKLSSDQEEIIDMAKKKGRIYLRRHGNDIETEEITVEESKVVITGGILD